MGIMDKKLAMSLAKGKTSSAMSNGAGGSGSGSDNLKKFDRIWAILKAVDESGEAYRKLLEALETVKGVKIFDQNVGDAFDATLKRLEDEDKLLNLLIGRYRELKSVVDPTVEQQKELRDIVGKIGNLAPEALEGIYNIHTIQNVNIEKALAGLKEQRKFVGDFSGMDAGKWVEEFHRETMEIYTLQKELSDRKNYNKFFGPAVSEDMSDSERKVKEETLHELEEKRKVILKLLSEVGMTRGEIITEIEKTFRTSFFDWKNLTFGDLEFEEQKRTKEYVTDMVDRNMDIKTELAKLSPTVEEQIAELEKCLKVQTQGLQKMLQLDSRASLEDIKAQIASVFELKNDLDILRGKTSSEQPKTKTIASNLKQQVDVEKILFDNQIKLEEERLSFMEDSKNKRLALSALEHKKREGQIRQELASQQSIFDSAGKVMPEEVKADFNKRIDQNDTEKIEQDRAIEKQYEDELKQRTEALTQFFLTEEERKRQAVKERYEEQRQWAKNQEGVDLTKQQSSSFILKVDEAEQREQYTRLLAGLNDFEAERDSITREWDARIETAEGNEGLASKLEEGKQKSLSALGTGELMQSEEWTNLFDNLDELTIAQIDKLMEDIQTKMGEVQGSLGASGAKINVVDMKAITGKLNEAKQKIATLNPFRAMGDSMKDIFGKGADEAGNASQEIGDKWKNLGKSTKGCFEFVNDAVGSCNVLSDVIGESGQQTMGMIQGVATAGIMMAGALKNVEKGSVVLAVISAALMAVNALSSLFNKDKKQEKKIQRLQGQIDDLEHAYDRLGTAMENTYSDEVYQMMDDQNDNLREQQELIKQQIEAEDKKKKTDKKKIKDWQNELVDIDEKIKENERKQIEMLAGTDVQSAIDSFADALTEAYAKGEDGAEALGATTKKVMANAVKESLKKKFLGDAINDAVNFLGNAMGDGVLTEAEQAQFEEMVQKGGENFTKAMDTYQNMFRDADGAMSEGVTGQLQAAMTEGTASQLVGLWNTTASDVRAIREWLLTGVAIAPESPFDMTRMIDLQNEIAVNTRATAQSTTATMYELRDGLGRMNERLGAIEMNTRGYAGRGR